jgi:chaperonin GroEL
MSAKSLLFHEHAREKMCDGLNMLADAVKITLGPRGRTVVLGNRLGAPTIINSGVTVAREIELVDPFENVGAQLVREVAAKTSEMAGDGTTTATVLAQAIVRQGMKFVAAGFDPMELKRGIDLAVATVIARLQQNSRPVSADQEIAQIGTISANGDAGIGDMIAEAMQRVGREGVIKAEDGRGMQNELQVVEGLQFDRGYVSPYFIVDAQKDRVVLDDALILLYPKNITAINELLPVLEQVMKAGRALLIVAEDVSGDALATLVINTIRGTLKTCAVKAPGFGEQRKALLEDIAVLTGTHVVDSEAGLALDKLPMAALGHASRVEIDRDSTAIIGGGGAPDAIANRIAQIRQQVADTAESFGRKRLEERAARLAGGVALIRVGASTETEMKEKRSRVEDALHATRAAVEEGIGAGGGVALLRAREAIAQMELPNIAQTSGVRIVCRALEEPLRQIIANAGGEADVIVEKVAQGTADFGYNAATDAYGSLTDMGVIDPTKVTRLALANAASIAGLVLTTDCIVVEHPSAQAAAGMESSLPAIPGL